MKIIDLYVKIANGEKVPKEIKVNDKIYYYDETDCNEFYRYRTASNELLADYAYINNEVEIIEDTPKEDKKIEKLDLSDWWEITSSEDCKPEMLANIFNKNAKAFSRKINEIIDSINRKK